MTSHLRGNKNRSFSLQKELRILCLPDDLLLCACMCVWDGGEARIPHCCYPEGPRTLNLTHRQTHSKSLCLHFKMPGKPHSFYLLQVSEPLELLESQRWQDVSLIPNEVVIGERGFSMWESQFSKPHIRTRLSVHPGEGSPGTPGVGPSTPLPPGGWVKGERGSRWRWAAWVFTPSWERMRGKAGGEPRLGKSLLQRQRSVKNGFPPTLCWPNKRNFLENEWSINQSKGNVAGALK